jgi:hypothetical protein
MWAIGIKFACLIQTGAEVVRNDDVPQSVGDAMDCGWEWLRVRCGYCHRSARIMFAASRREETLDSLARKARWRRCPDLTPLIDFKLGVETDVREKAIAFEGDRPHEARVGNDEPTSMQIGSVWCPQITLPPKLGVIKTEEEAREGIARNRPSGSMGRSSTRGRRSQVHHMLAWQHSICL